MFDKGAPDGKRYVFPGESNEIPDVDPGDVIVEINIKKHKKFIRKGGDLLYNADITLLEALTGFEIVITHLDGREVLIRTKQNEIIKPGCLRQYMTAECRSLSLLIDSEIYISILIFFFRRAEQRTSIAICVWANGIGGGSFDKGEVQSE